jgi:hypothetical protein
VPSLIKGSSRVCDDDNDDDDAFNHSVLGEGLNLREFEVPLEDVEAAQDAGVEVALPGLDVVVGVVPEARQVGRHRPVVPHQRPEYR